MNRKYIYPLVIIIVTVALYYADDFFEKDTNSVENSSSTAQRNSEEFNDSFLPASTTGAIVKHNFFTLSYSEKDEQAEWVAYELNRNDLAKNEFERPYFIEDRSVKTYSADWRNYKNSGYDRGHLCPAGDRRFSFEAYNETFLTSNISPQNHDFNAGIWNRLEQKVRFWAEKYDGVYVVTGGVLKGNMKTIGDENVSVPNEFYKIVVDASEGNYKAIAFLIPNKSSSESFYNYAISINEIEAKTGIDFFPNLPDSVETNLEQMVDLKAWGKK
ncbi:DNA/RNA non-specific endonuclease [Aequorivita lipolytica]|uniref:Endonuclease n=1 Tax=Aequorivita lipolytica TaxID=153267 RepID=A0A5C6YQL6_9FLAO|nr:DNA/RNA non-specific endonuclease [Aequorivita lipolytica]TXD69781.1 DNA/RNA non-specific endonuclease [Aequorivita lipolytica]SRX50409.1 Nuclease [Aequorivita lipolytica]